MIHSDYKPNGERKGTNDGYWAARDASDNRARFREWGESPPLPKPAPLPEFPLTKEQARWQELYHKILHSHLPHWHALTDAERAEFEKLNDQDQYT